MGSLLTAAFLLGITIAGLSYMVSGAFPKALNFAKTAFANSLKGFVLALIAWIIINGIMNIVGYKHPFGGKWYQFECSTNSNGGKCNAKNKKLESIRIQCQAGNGEYISLDTFDEDKKNGQYQLTAIGKYSCDGESSEEDVTKQAQWKVSDETQIKVSGGMVQAIADSSTGENPPYVEANLKERKSNAMRIYINSCPVTAFNENQGMFEDAAFGGIINAANAQSRGGEAVQATNQQGFWGTLKGWYDYATTPKTPATPSATPTPTNESAGTCKSACPKDPKNTCHFVYGNENAKYIFIFYRVNDSPILSCSGDKWKGDAKEFAGFMDTIKNQFAIGIDYSAEKNDFGVFASSLVGYTKDSSCPPSRDLYGRNYVLKGMPTTEMLAYSIKSKAMGVYCSDYSNVAIGGKPSEIFAHEQIGHGFGKLNDEYVSATKYNTDPPIYNCASLQTGCKKWGDPKLTCYPGCLYSNDYVRSADNSIMNNGNDPAGFGVVNDKIIKYAADHKLVSGPPEWANP